MAEIIRIYSNDNTALMKVVQKILYERTILENLLRTEFNAAVSECTYRVDHGRGVFAGCKHSDYKGTGERYCVYGKCPRTTVLEKRAKALALLR